MSTKEYEAFGGETTYLSKITFVVSSTF